MHGSHYKKISLQITQGSQTFPTLLAKERIKRHGKCSKCDNM